MDAAILEPLQEDQLASLLPPDQVGLHSEVVSAADLEVPVAADFEVASVAATEEASGEEEEGLATRAAVALAEEVGMAVVPPTAMVAPYLPPMLLPDLGATAVVSQVDTVARQSMEA